MSQPGPEWRSKIPIQTRLTETCHPAMPLLDNGLAAVAVILLECESFVGSSYRVLQEHCTRAVDRRIEADPSSGGEERVEISMARLSKMISTSRKPQGSYSSSNQKSLCEAWPPLIPTSPSIHRSISTSVPTMQTMLCRNIIARAIVGRKGHGHVIWGADHDQRLHRCRPRSTGSAAK